MIGPINLGDRRERLPFTYRTRKDFSRKVKDITGWSPDLSRKEVPESGRGDRPCTGITLRYDKIKTFNIEYNVPRFPQLGWARLDSGLTILVMDGTDLYDEGEPRLRAHKSVERNARLRAKAKAYWRAQQGRLRCSVCGFDFEERYGTRGTDFVELHHERPLASTGRTRNSPQDLKPLCSNCHRMVHRYRDEILSLDELRKLLRKSPAGRA